MAMGRTGSMPSMDDRMNAMQDMHQKMVNAGTPAERQALMVDHMKAMQGGMAMMNEMQAMPADMAKRHQMMIDHMAMMKTLMDMMADRMPTAWPAK
jgi:hypothetical protein